jgi:hypothetical protein
VGGTVIARVEDVIKHQTFGWSYRPFPLLWRAERHREIIRREAQTFINTRVGVDNVVAVSEGGSRWGTFWVSVWYRDTRP